MVTRREKRWSTQRPKGAAPVSEPADDKGRTALASVDTNSLTAYSTRHARSQSWLTTLLKPNTALKRRSVEPAAGPRPLRDSKIAADCARSHPTASTSAQRRPSVVARKPVPVIKLGDEDAHPPRQATLSWPVTNKNLLKSTSMPIHLALKPLPIAAEDEKARLAAWNWGQEGNSPVDHGFVPSPAQSPSFVKRRVQEIERKETATARCEPKITASRRSSELPPPPVPERDRPTSTATICADGPSRRASALSDLSADIAFSGPILHNPQPTLPVFAARDEAFVSATEQPHSRRPRTLSPIFETESSACHSSHGSVVDVSLVEKATLQSVPTARPILHVDPAAAALRKSSASSASVYSCAATERDLQSYFSPSTPPADVSLQLDGLAISGVYAASLSPSAPASPRHPVAVHDRQPFASAIALTNKPSFSKYRFPSPDRADASPSPSPSPPTSESGRVAFLFDPSEGLLPPEEGEVPSSSVTAATSTFDSPQLSSELKASTASSTGTTGEWRTGWTLAAVPDEPVDLSESAAPSVAGEAIERVAEARPAVSEPAAAPAVLLAPRRASRPVSFALPDEIATPYLMPDRDSKTLDLGTRTLSIQRKKSKVLPEIPDSASIWSGEDRVEVYCQRELVRHHGGRTERVILERTLLFEEGEAAPLAAVGVAV